MATSSVPDAGLATPGRAAAFVVGTTVVIARLDLHWQSDDITASFAVVVLVVLWSVVAVVEVEAVVPVVEVVAVEAVEAVVAVEAAVWYEE